jgi:pimeloyl-ACP methyl ester carboxylesterase
MAQVAANNIRLEYDTFGPRDGRPLFLIMGLASQMVGWPPDFCDKLVDRGHFVIRFDNRDVGLSSKIEEGGVPSIEAILAGSLLEGGDVDAPYTLSDMAADTRELIRALGIPRAHVCGISMGGMIAQTLAIEHPECVAGLISLESSTGEPGLPPPKPEAAQVLFQPPPADREGYIDHMATVFRTFAGGSPLFDEALQREILSLAFERCYYPLGFLRQMAAIMVSGSRRERLGSVKAPTLVIHGSLDPLVLPEHGRATAEAVPGAELHMVEGLGHGIAFPRLWDEIVLQISDHTENVD